jgi:hypothetical protein
MRSVINCTSKACTDIRLSMLGGPERSGDPDAFGAVVVSCAANAPVKLGDEVETSHYDAATMPR